MSNLVSIVVPCYNQAQYLDECLQSVYEQTCENWECIIVSDDSPDNTEEVAAKWLEKDKRFRYYKKTNGGVSSARNFGLEKANGKWILPLDADDKIAKTYVESALEKLLAGYDVVYCLAEFFGEKTGPYFIKNHTFENLLQGNTIFCSAFFNKEKSNGIRYDENLVDGFEDWEFWISYLSQPATKVFRIEETLFYYRIKEHSRNQEINCATEKTQRAKMYILHKHFEKYELHFGDYWHLLHENHAQKDRIAELTKILNSKRHRWTDKIFKFIHK